MFPTRIGADLRAPAQFGTSARAVYATALEMATYADAAGIDAVELPEHHGADDGYLPSPFLVGCAMAARTRRIAINLGAVILPLHDPVKIAEQIAVADLVSDGRINVVLGAGYSEREFDAFGVTLGDRRRLMDDGVEIIVRALSGERFTHKDRPVFVRPLPASWPPNLYIGGGVPASAERAARFGLGFAPMPDELIPVYEAECRKLGREPGPVIRLAPAVHIFEDPEEGWAEIGENLLYFYRTYASWSSSKELSSSPMHGLDTIEAVRASGLVHVLTPDEAVAFGHSRPISLHPLMGGIRPETGWRSLELFVAKVLPRLKADAASPVEESLEEELLLAAE